MAAVTKAGGGTLYLVGLGLGDEKDITVAGLEVVKRCKAVYLEAYTSILGVEKSSLETFYGRGVDLMDRKAVEQGCNAMLCLDRVDLMDREAVEQECDAMLEMAKTEEVAFLVVGDVYGATTDTDNDLVAFLVVGDVYGATTHTDIAVRARDLGVRVKVIHNASIMNACGACGLQLYNFGQTVSICFFTETWRPDSFIDKVLFNKRAGLHTLCLLDIKVKEQSEENMARGRRVYSHP
ncbi:tetrapyrrole methylase [Baffinella frigidus]|nr:tetrapyrrole methylase [Cryptophyta sp. CCMP2293]